MATSPDCSLTGYLNEITRQYEQCLKKHLCGSNEIGCLARAALLGASEIAAQCESITGVDCTPKGYVAAVVEAIDIESKTISIALKKVSKKIVKTLVPQGLGSAAGCIVGGSIGGVGGFILTRNQLGVCLGAVQGCSWGSKVGTRLAEQYVGPIRVVVKIGEKIATVQVISKAIETHSNLCKAENLAPFQLEADRWPIIPFEAERAIAANRGLNPIALGPRIPLNETLPQVEEQNREGLEESPLQMPTEDLLEVIGGQLVDYAGQMSGVLPALNEIKQLQEIMTCLAKNPVDGVQMILTKYMQTPKNMVDNVLKGPEDFLKKGELLLKDSAGGCLGALAVCGSILSFMSSVTWIADFIRDPKHMAIAALKMPYTIVKGVVELGIAFIRNPGKTALSFCKTLIKSPVHIVKGFMRAIRFKKRKKKHKALPVPSISPQEQERLFKKYVADLVALYTSVKYNWFIDPFKTIEEYHCDLMADFKNLATPVCQNFFDFPALLTTKLDQQDFATVWAWSPRAHPKETIAPPEVVQAYIEIGQSMVRVEVASRALEAAHQINVAANIELNAERHRLQNNVAELGAVLNNNENRIAQALRTRINVRQNQ